MATKEEITESLQQVNQRLEGLKARILAGAEKHLLSGTWTVRDALCHLAARSNGLPNFMNRLERAAQATPGAPATPLPNIDDVNQSQIDARVGRTPAELLDEVHAGHLTAIDGVSKMDADIFDRELPTPRGEGTTPAGDLLMRSTSGHDNVHLDEIEKALDA